MACNSCSTGKDGQPKGCKNNGTCGTDSCNKLTVFDWLSNMSLPNGEKPFNWVEVRFKNGRKNYYKNSENLTLSIGDVVATQAQAGHDVGMVTLAGELVKVQMKRKKIAEDSEETLKVYRKASQKDIDIWSTARDKEEAMKVKARQFAIDLKLQMKISDIEYQGDASKATFYYTAEERVDFRELIKVFAKEFRTRIEMKQVGFRQEAARLGGIGSCGRELCCSTWLTDFRKVTTSAARYQQLSLNPLKLAGQCGKLKCCLNFELNTYLDALKAFPKQDLVLKTEKGDAVFVKMDIFKNHLWYTYKEERFKWFRLTLEQVLEIVDLNKNDEKSMSLEEYEADVEIPVKVDFEDAVGQDSLTRFDLPKTNKRKNNRNRNKKKTVKAVANTNNKNNSKPRPNPNQKRKPQAKKQQNPKQNPNQKSNPNSPQKSKPQAKIKPKQKPRHQGNVNPQEGDVKKANKPRPRPKGNANQPKGEAKKVNKPKPRPQGNANQPKGDVKKVNKPKPKPQVNENKTEGDVKKVNKPRRNNRNRKNNSPKKDDNSEKK
jgi:cell fate regulator YaaT (PSP1 superfamily)